MSGGASARQYGIRFEQELARWFGCTTTRNSRPGLHDDAGDLLIEGVAVEAKARHCGTGGTPPRWSIWSWMRQIEQKADDSQIPCLIVKRPGQPVGRNLIIANLEDLNELARRLA